MIFSTKKGRRTHCPRRSERWEGVPWEGLFFSGDNEQAKEEQTLTAVKML